VGHPAGAGGQLHLALVGRPTMRQVLDILTINYLYEELRDDPDGVEAEILEILGFGGDVPRKR
jgi:hypothetical protein